jgi:hypothetical protein
METKPLPLESGQAQNLAVIVDGTQIGIVGRWARDRGREWFFKNASGAYGQVRTKQDAIASLFQIARGHNAKNS